MNARNVLLLADLFPPQFAPRVAYLVNFLARSGWNVTVVTEQIVWQHTGSHGAVLTGFDSTCRVLRLSLAYRGSGLAEAFLHLKSRRLVKEIEQRFEARHFDLIMAFTYRSFPLPAARILSKKWQIPFMADCRDIVEQYSRFDFLPHRYLCGWGIVERFVMELLAKRFISTRTHALSTACGITTVSEWHREVLQRLHPTIPVRVIANGFDEQLFAPAVSPSPKFSIVFTGRLLSRAMRDPSLLIEAMQRESLRPWVVSGQLVVEWFVDEHSRSLLRDILRPYAPEIVRANVFHEMIPFEQVPRELNRASIVLLLGNKASEHGPHGMVTTKVFEAMATRRPLLLIRSDESIVAELLKTYGGGCAATSVTEVENFVLHYLNQWKQNGYTMPEGLDSSWIAQHSRKHMAELFVQEMERVLAKPYRGVS